MRCVITTMLAIIWTASVQVTMLVNIDVRDVACTELKRRVLMSERPREEADDVGLSSVSSMD